jgi:cytoplasmic iron level regulating protein YaaA (DUF328/UPF0246 family)
MNVVEGPPYVEALPRFLDHTRRLLDAVRELSYDEAKARWKCSDALARLSYERFRDMDLESGLTCACLAYEGIQYQHLAPQVTSEGELAYLRSHLRILSGFYGVLAPCDGVVPYRLEMQARLGVDGRQNLYAFWKDAICASLAEETDTLVNVASAEYAKAVLPYAGACGLKVVTCVFYTPRNGRFVQPSTEAKAARGVFCRWCAEHEVDDVSQLASFNERGYAYDEGLSGEGKMAFVRRQADGKCEEADR